MRKEPIIFLVTLAVLAGLWFLSGSGDSPTGRAGRGKGGTSEAQVPVAAKSSPGKFIPETEVTWAGSASNIFETPTETRDLPPLDLAPPPFPRLPHPGPPLPFPIGAQARAGLRRTIVPTAAPGAPDDGTNGQKAAPQDQGGATTNPTPTGTGNEPLVPLGTQLSQVERIKMSLEAEEQRLKDEAKAKQSEEERRKSLDKVTLTNGQTLYGEVVPTDRNDNRYALKRDLDKIRTDPGLTEPDRNDKLKKFKSITVREDKRGKLGKGVPYPADLVATITFADTPENRYRMGLLDAAKNDLAQQMELAKIVFNARLFPLAAEHLSAMRTNGLSSPEMLTMLADAYHEQFRYNDEINVLRQAVKEFPDSVPVLGRLGRLQVKLGMSDRARASFEKALEKSPNDALANAGMGDVLMRAGDPVRAIAHLREALNQAGSDATKVDAIRLLLAEAYLRSGDFKNAHETVDLVLARANVAAAERARIFERAFGLAALAALGQGQLAEARTRAEEGARRYPLSGLLSYVLGIVLAQQGENAAARPRLAAAAELDPLLTGHSQVALAIVEEATGHDDAAVSTAEAGATVASPSSSELRLPFGRALLHVGDLGRAREQLLAALDHEPKSADALAAMGDLSYNDTTGGGLPDAIRFYDRAAEVEPGFPQLLARRIITQVRRRKLAEAEELASRAGSAELKDPFVQAALAYFQYAKGNHAEALNGLQRLGDSASGPLADYAKSAHAALVAHQNKTMWVDTFSRTAQIGRGWNLERGQGVNMALQNQSIVFDGAQKVSDTPTILWQERPGDRLFGFSTDLDLPVQPGVYAGVGLMVFNQGKPGEKWPGFPDRAGGLQPYTGLQVALSPEGQLVYRVLVKGRMADWAPVPQTTYAGGPVTIELRLADPREGVVEVLVNRESVLRQTLADLKRFRRAIDLQIFCYAHADRKVHFSADNVVVVTLKDPK